MRGLITVYCPATRDELWSSPGGASGRDRMSAAERKNRVRSSGDTFGGGLPGTLDWDEAPPALKVTYMCGVNRYAESSETVLASDWMFAAAFPNIAVYR